MTSQSAIAISTTKQGKQDNENQKVLEWTQKEIKNFYGGKKVGQIETVLTGFLDAKKQIQAIQTHQASKKEDRNEEKIEEKATTKKQDHQDEDVD